MLNPLLQPADWTPHADKAEWHLTYRCDLACPGCNRFCFLPPQTPDMTMDDAREFCRQADALKWRPRIMIIGGEPTLHPHFVQFCQLAAEFNARSEVWSNGHSATAQSLLCAVESFIAVQWGTVKQASVAHPVADICVAPMDFGWDREPCGTHAAYTQPDCGVSVDHNGYTLCCMGGAIDGALKLGLRTKHLADLFDADWARRHTEALCMHCGQHLQLDRHYPGACKTVRGTAMSSTWLLAAERITEAVA